MRGGRTVEAFEPVLIEEGGERRLAESRLPDDPEQRGCRFVSFALQRREGCGALGCDAVDRVRTGSEPELDEPSPLGRSQRKMGDFVQDHVGLGRGRKRCSVPVEVGGGSLAIDRHAEGASDRERREAMPLGLRSGGAVQRRRADSPKHRAREAIGEAGREAV